MLLRWWKDLAVGKKLYAVVGVMLLLIVSELFCLLFAMNVLSAIRAFVEGEGLWTKSEKNAVHSLYQYALSGNENFLAEFKHHLEITEGDRFARREVERGDAFNYSVAREGFIRGGNHPKDIDSMIAVLRNFPSVSYVKEAIRHWAAADNLLDELRDEAEEMQSVIRLEGRRSESLKPILARVARLNESLTEHERAFSASLSAGSRWLEQVLLIVFVLSVFVIEGSALVLTYRFSTNLNRSLWDMMETANSVRRGDFTALAPVRSSDELGHLAGALNKMILDLRASVEKGKRTEDNLRRLNEELEERVKARTVELQFREFQLRSITNALPVLVAQLDQNQKFLFANSTYCTWAGRSLEQILGRTIREVFGEVRYQINEPQITKVLAGQRVTFERQTVHQNQNRTLQITFVPETDDADVVTGFIVLGSDITKHKATELELKRARDAADVANAAKSAFLANMSHEIRTPLGAILGFSEILAASDVPPAERTSAAAIIARNGQLLSNLINDILDLSKVESGKLEIERTEVPLHEITGEIDTLLALKAAEKGLTLSLSIDENVPKAVVTDPLRVRQILLNIVGNAIKFTESGSIDVHICMDKKASGQLLFVVKDTGLGISSDQVERLFAPFSQADVSTTRLFGGTGLGLVLAKRLANALGGDVFLAESTANKGSVFVISIDPGQPGEALPEALPSRKVPSRGKPARLAEHKILVVDDSLDNQILVKHFLRSTGIKVDTAKNGRDGVEKALNGDFDLVLMDLQMPVMDGYQAISLLRAQGYEVPVIAMTAHAMKNERKLCIERGFNDHMSKPFNRDTLLHALTQHFA